MGESQLITALHHAHENGALLLSADWARISMANHGYYPPRAIRHQASPQGKQPQARQDGVKGSYCRAV